MANCLSVEVTGAMPFSICQIEDDTKEQAVQTVRSFMAQTLIPCYGFKLRFNEAKSFYKKNKHGGKTLYFPFEISGTEAMWESNFKTIIKAFKEAGAIIDFYSAEDINF